MLELIDEASKAGVPQEDLCARVGVSARTLQRWRKPETAEDRRRGPKTIPANSLSERERRRLLALANSEEMRELPPKQVVPRLADRGVYVASESTLYRLLRRERQLAHRGRARPPQPRPVPNLLATAPNQLWTWDITYLRGPIRGTFLYLYLVVDVFSRRVMGWRVEEEESMALAAALLEGSWLAAGRPEGLTLHSDNGGPMKGTTMLATLQALGVVPSFSRPRVSDDNPFSEALFRTLKYRPAFPERPFESKAEAVAWVERFVAWYNGAHRHSAIRFVTPDERYFGREREVLAARTTLYQRARARHPERWSREIRNWTRIASVRLGPDPDAPKRTTV
jgi:putative transposase